MAGNRRVMIQEFALMNVRNCVKLRASFTVPLLQIADSAVVIDRRQ